MKNFIFKSDADFHKILFNKLELILRVLKEQRLQLDRIEWNIKRNEVNKRLQKQVDEYFEDGEAHPGIDDDAEHIPEE